MKSVVITSTNKLEDTFIDRFLTQDNQVVVVGDVKTDAASYENQQLIYIPIECESHQTFERELPTNHYCRKNLGYLSAINSGATSILDTDDDNYPIGDINSWGNFELKKVTSPRIPNILTEFSDRPIWARGYPLEYINKAQPIETQSISQADFANVGIVQSLVDGNPDVDAIYRLTSSEYTDDFRFKDALGFVFAEGVFSQGNTQATLWSKPEIFHLLYIPSTVSFRFCDILKMYIAQRCMWEYGLNFAVVSPFFRQVRNAHDYMEDFKSETSMYISVLELLSSILPNIKLYGDKEDLIRVYEVLIKKGMVQKEELRLLKLFLERT
mgnify:FL=1